MMILEEGKAAKRTDQLLDALNAQRERYSGEIARLDWAVTYAQIVVANLCQDCTEEQRELLFDLADVLHDCTPSGSVHIAPV